VALTEMTTTIDCERETINFDSIHEYLRESNLPTRDAAVSMSSNLFNQRQMNVEETSSEHEPPKTDELEALWPGVHHDFPQQGPSTKSASFYLSVGFAAGALLSIVGIFGYFSVSHLVTAKAAPAPNANQVLVAGVPAGPQGGTATGSGDVLVPTTGSYQVQPGDTLAGIAVRNYKKVSPRLLDEICKANNMRNANVLSLGQKIVLPEYHASNQIAATTTSTMQ
jgi:LysM repeat protein